MDFKKALDLLDFLPTSGASASDLEEEKENLRLKIWARSVLRNPWSTLETGDPIAVIAETVFFRLVRFSNTYERFCAVYQNKPYFLMPCTKRFSYINFVNLCN